MPFCDSTLSLEARVKDAVSRMTLAEKISALGTKTGEIKSLGNFPDTKLCVCLPRLDAHTRPRPAASMDLGMAALCS